MPDTTYVALLRGINVGGRNRVKMADLRAMLEGLGFEDVRLYIQSGNAVFRAPDGSREAVAGRIEDAFEERFGFGPRVMVRTAPEWRQLVRDNPFGREAEDGTKVHVALLDAEPAQDALKALAVRAAALTGRDAEDRYAVRGTVLYVHTPNGLGRSKLAALLATLKVDMTMRNWRTVLALEDLVGEIS